MKTTGKRSTMGTLAVFIVVASLTTGTIGLVGIVTAGRTGLNSATQLPGDATYNGTTYLESDLGAYGSCSGPTGYVPCFGGSSQSQAEAFACTDEAASLSGCTQEVFSRENPQYHYDITIWYPIVGQLNETSNQNCKYVDSGEIGQTWYATCLSINATSFIVIVPPP